MQTAARVPTKEELTAAAGGSLPDLIRPGLRILFCGINPGLYSAATQRHFARPGNRFWPALYKAGFTERLLSPWENTELLAAGHGLTCLVNRATAAAREVSHSELRAGARQLQIKVEEYQPAFLAVMGIGAFRTAFDAHAAQPGPQQLEIGSTRVWLLPSPSGANASYPPTALIGQFRLLAEASKPQ